MMHLVEFLRDSIFVDSNKMVTLEIALDTVRDIIENKFKSQIKPIEIEELKNKNVTYYNPFDFVQN